MQRDPAKLAYRYARSKRVETDNPPMNMLEAAIFFGVISLILDGLGAVVARVTGVSFMVLLCLSAPISVFLTIATGFVAARYTAVINGVWAGIMVAAITAVFGQLILVVALPDYRDLAFNRSQTAEVVSTGSAIGMALGIVLGAIGTIVGGAIFGLIGASFSQLAVFRPKYEDGEEA